MLLFSGSNGFSCPKQWVFESEHMELRGRRYTPSGLKVHSFGTEVTKASIPGPKGGGGVDLVD